MNSANTQVRNRCCARAFPRLAFILLAGLLTFSLSGCCTAPAGNATAKVRPRTFSSFDEVNSRDAKQEDFNVGTINFINTDLSHVLQIYQEISGRTVIRPATLPAPTISVRNQTPLNKVQALQLLDTVLAQNGITMVLAGDTAVKAVPEVRAPMESPPEITLPWKALPDSGSYMMRRVRLQRLRPSEVVPALQPLSKVHNSILPLDSSRELVLRDYASNIRRMLQLLEDLENNRADAHSSR